MVKNYKLKVKVEIVESDQEAGAELVQTEAGQFEIGDLRRASDEYRRL